MVLYNILKVREKKAHANLIHTPFWETGSILQEGRDHSSTELSLGQGLQDHLEESQCMKVASKNGTALPANAFSALIQDPFKPQLQEYCRPLNPREPVTQAPCKC